MSQPAPATHESKGILFYTGPESSRFDPLAPYWALSDLVINSWDGYHEVETTIDGEDLSIRVNYHKSGVAPRDDDPIDGDRLYEWDISIDGDGERGGSYQLKPRFKPMRHYESGDELTFPFHHVADEGVAIQWNMSNLSFEEVSDLFPRILRSIFEAADSDLNERYLTAPAGGTIQEVEQYVRITRENAKKIINSGGIMERLAMLLSDVSGVAGTYKFDNTEADGYIHQFRTGPNGASELVDVHEYGKQLKLYLPENPDAFDPDEALYHHKLGALYRKSIHGGSVRWSERDQLLEELDEALFNLLSWSDIPTDSGPGFVSDDHFSPEPRDGNDSTLYSDPTPRLEADQDALFLKTFEDLSGSRLDLVREVATDGGKHVEDVADSIDVAVSTVYRALGDLPDLLESDDGVVRFRSAKLAEEVRGIVDRVEETIEKSADRAAELIDHDIRSRSTSIFERWLAEYGAEFHAPGADASEADEDRPVIRIDTLLADAKSRTEPLLEAALNEALVAWREDGRDVLELREALVDVDLAGKGSVRAPLRTLR